MNSLLSKILFLRPRQSSASGEKRRVCTHAVSSAKAPQARTTLIDTPEQLRTRPRGRRLVLCASRCLTISLTEGEDNPDAER
ncbi:hypothetical protein [Ruficoccus sp. ZRK36]|uniref:hypothetical protein n=1 Tax=Ruficoccus sp. ZRK36 TaxID=2866311 RepID=UPI001C734FFF|nr:hypothetical protein [Ruficoccus sp. ZRK36]QYY35803.1 hypothetical protein K0V07_16075 [Ruficoccus sp. ZRK36]